MSEKKIVILLADQFEEIEVTAPLDIWRRAGFVVELASIRADKQAVGQQGLLVYADRMLEEIFADNFDLIFIPGGAGYKLIEQSEPAMTLIREFFAQQKYIASICAGPSILAELLKDKKATCYPSMKDCLKNWIDQPVVVDLPFITSQGPGTAMELGFQVVELLAGLEKMQLIRTAMIYT